MTTTTFTATHEIIFTPANGAPHIYTVHLVDGAAYTREEWESESAADWERTDDGEWRFQGQATPGGAVGTVTVREADLYDYDVREVFEGVESEPLAIFSTETAAEHAQESEREVRAYDGDRRVWTCDASGEWRWH